MKRETSESEANSLFFSHENHPLKIHQFKSGVVLWEVEDSFAVRLRDADGVAPANDGVIDLRV